MPLVGWNVAITASSSGSAGSGIEAKKEGGRLGDENDGCHVLLLEGNYLATSSLAHLTTSDTTISLTLTFNPSIAPSRTCLNVKYSIFNLIALLLSQLSKKKRHYIMPAPCFNTHAKILQVLKFSD